MNRKIGTRIIFIIALGIVGCSAPVKIAIGGSETMREMMEIITAEYNKNQKAYRAEVKGGGSKAGIESLIDGMVDIAMTSNDIKETHLDAIADLKKIERVEVGYDGLSVIVHPSNKLEKIDLNKFSQVLSGKVKNFREIDGPDMAIQVALRNKKSGTEAFVREQVLQKKGLGEVVHSAFKNAKYSKDAKVLATNEEIISYVSSNKGAIAYVGMGIAKTDGKGKVKVLAYSLNPEGPYLIPTVENIQERKYKLSRALTLIYESGNPARENFIEYVLGEEGQKKILEYGYMQAALGTLQVREKRVPAENVTP